MNTLLSACFGFVVAAGLDRTSKWGKPDISMSCNGMLAGLVAITARVRVRRPVGGVPHRDHRRVRSSATASSSSTRCSRSTTRAVRSRCTGCAGCGVSSRSGSSPTAPTARVGTAWRATSPGLFYGDGGQLVRPGHQRRRSGSSGPGVSRGSSSSIVKRFMAIRVTPEAEIEGLDMPEFGALLLPGLRAATRDDVPGTAVRATADDGAAAVATGRSGRGRWTHMKLITAVVKPHKFDDVVRRAPRARRQRHDAHRGAGPRPATRSHRALPGCRVHGRVRSEVPARGASSTMPMCARSSTRSPRRRGPDRSATGRSGSSRWRR